MPPTFPWLLPAALLAWSLACAAAAHGLTRIFFDRAVRTELRPVVFIALLPLITADEMVGRPQFDELCRARAVITITASDATGRAVVYSERAPQDIPGMFVPVTSRLSVYLDASTGEPVLSYETLSAHGGRLVRALGGTAHDAAPLTFDGHCEPANRAAVFGALHLRIVPREVAGTSQSRGDAASADVVSERPI